MKEIEKTVIALLNLAMQAQMSGDALRFSQAALNAAHVKHALDKHN